VNDVDALCRALLYEGYLLYPYTPGATKNRVRWTFGTVAPRVWSEAGGCEGWRWRAECLLVPGPGCRLEVSVRFLHLCRCQRRGAEREEASERRLEASLVLSDLLQAPSELPLRLAAHEMTEGGASRHWEALEGRMLVSARPLPAAVTLAVEVQNLTPLADLNAPRERVTLHSLCSTHAVLRASPGRFCSLADPPPSLAEAAAACHCIGCWPVLAGEPGRDDTLLCSPIIVDDHPRLAPESPGDLFDSSEIDELLSLRVLTLSEEEKAELRGGDAHARGILERTEHLTPEQWLRLHGTLRNPEAEP
jgi:hypothetical protein